MHRSWSRALASIFLVIAWLVLAAPPVPAQTDPPAPPLNGFSDPAPAAGPEFAPDPPKALAAYNPRWELSSEMVYFLFRSPNPHFPLATTGSINDNVPGALGQPGTRILADASAFKEGFHIGTKLLGTYWLSDEPEGMGVQASLFMMEYAPVRFQISSAGGSNDLVLARPFFNAGLGREDSDPRAVPNALGGDINLRFHTRLYGADTSFIYNASGYSRFGPSLFFLIGPRFVGFDETYSSDERAIDLPPVPASIFVIQDTFATRNFFAGAQVGTQFRYHIDGITFDLLTKVAAGNNFERLTINGFTSVTDQATGALVAVGNQGLFAQPSNVGQYTRNTFSVIPELALKLHVDLTQTIKVTLGYGLMAMTQVARPADQLDRNINIQPVGAPAQIGPAFPVRPTSITQTNFWANYFSLGVELVF